MKIRSIKRMLIVSILVLLVLVVGLLWRLSESLIDRSDRKETENTEIETETTGKMEFKPNTEEGEGEYLIQKPSLIYDKDSYEEDMKSFLGSNYDKFEEVLSSIREDYQKIFMMLPGEYEIRGSNPKTVYIENDSSIGLGELEDKYDSLSINKSLTIIGFVGDTTVIYAYGYPECISKELIVLDYSERGMRVQGTDMLKVGNVDSAFIPLRATKLMEYGEYRVLYSK